MTKAEARDGRRDNQDSRTLDVTRSLNLLVKKNDLIIGRLIGDISGLKATTGDTLPFLTDMGSFESETNVPGTSSPAVFALERIQHDLVRQGASLDSISNALHLVHQKIQDSNRLNSQSVPDNALMQKLSSEASQILKLLSAPRLPASLVSSHCECAAQRPIVSETETELRAEIGRLQAECNQVRDEKNDAQQTLVLRLREMERRLAEVQQAESAASRQLADARDRHREFLIKFMRAESFRKALVYQKRYLILLLGGFQESEDVTLSVIASMGVQLPSRPRQAQARARLRSAMICALAVARLRILMRRWAVRQAR